MESEMVGEMTWVEDIRVWEDAGQAGWARVLDGVLSEDPAEIWIEAGQMPAIVRQYLDARQPRSVLRDIGPVLRCSLFPFLHL